MRFNIPYHLVITWMSLLLLASCAIGVTDEPATESAPEELTTADLLTPEPTVQPIASPTANITEGCVNSYDEAVDYFPEKTAFGLATGVNIQYFPHYKIITVTNPWQDANATFQYILVQCGTPQPDGYEGALFIEVPVHSVVTMIAAQLSHLEELDEINSLVGLDSFDYASNADIRAKIAAGELVNIGSGTEVNIEATLNLAPDIVMTFGSGFPDFDSHPALIEAGIPTVLNSAYMEETPLGRAEWLKFTAVFFNKEARANDLFTEQAASYQKLASLTAALPHRPTAFLNVPRGDTWSMPGGHSYQAQFLADTGAAYLWADDNSSGNLSLDFESVFEQAAEADYWINPGQRPLLTTGKAADERFTEFAAFQNGNLYDNNASLNEFGGNLYWEQGVTHPDRILADLIKIFHPDLLPDHELIFFQQLIPAD